MLKKILLLIFLPVALMAEVDYEDMNASEKLEHQLQKANKNLEYIIILLERLVEDVGVEVWDIDGNRIR